MLLILVNTEACVVQCLHIVKVSKYLLKEKLRPVAQKDELQPSDDCTCR